MSTDLSGLFPALVGDGPSSEFPGLLLPDHATDAAFPADCGFSRQPPDACAACQRSVAEHKVWERVGFRDGRQVLTFTPFVHYFAQYLNGENAGGAVTVDVSANDAPLSGTRMATGWTTRPYGFGAGQFLWWEWRRPDGLLGVAFIFAPAQAGEPDLSITVTTGAPLDIHNDIPPNIYSSTLNILTDARWGWNTIQSFTLATGLTAPWTITGASVQTHAENTLPTMLAQLTPSDTPNWAMFPLAAYRLTAASNDSLTLLLSPEYAGDTVTLIAQRLGSQPKAFIKYWADKAEAMRENTRRGAALIDLLYKSAQGFADGVVASATAPPMVDFGGWEVNVASGNTISLKRLTGTPDPRNLPFAVPAWNEDGTPNFGSSTCILPAGSLLKISANSMADSAHHGGFIVKRLVPDGNTSVAVNGDFTLELAEPIGGNILELKPYATGQVTAGVACYLNSQEGYPCPQPYDALWTTFQHVMLTNGGADLDAAEYTLMAAARIADPAAAPMQIYKWTGEGLPAGQDLISTANWTGWAITAKAIYHQDTGAARLDLTAEIMTGIKAVWVDFFGQDDTSPGAVAWGADRCARDTVDYTATAKASDTQGRRCYCGAAGALTALGEEGTAALGRYAGGCYQLGTCPLYATRAPAAETGDADLAALLYGLPWQIRQTLAGLPEEYLTRLGCPGVAALVGSGRINTPTGYHPTVDSSFMVGGWGSGTNVIGGYHWLDSIDGVTAPDASNPATWPPRGPLAASPARLTEYNQAAADDDTDPAGTARCRPTSGARDYEQYKYGHTAGNLLERRRWRDYECWFPHLIRGYDAQTSNDGTFQRGFWDANFASVDHAEYQAYSPAAHFFIPYTQMEAAGDLQTIIIQTTGGSTLHGTQISAAPHAPLGLVKDAFFYLEVVTDSRQGVYFWFSPLNGGAQPDAALTIYATTAASGYTATVNLISDATWGWGTKFAISYQPNVAYAWLLARVEIITAGGTLTLTRRLGDTPPRWDQLGLGEFWCETIGPNILTVCVSPAWTGAVILTTIVNATAVYWIKITWQGVRYTRASALAIGPSVVNGGVATMDGLKLNIKSPVDVLSSKTMDDFDVTTPLCHGGALVAPPEFMRLRNWQSTQSYIGPGAGKIVAGHAVKFVDAALVGNAVYNRAFLVSKAEPYAGPAQSWIPDQTTEIQDAPLGGAFFLPYTHGEAAGGSLAVSVTRNSSAVTLAGLNVNLSRGFRPHDLLKDHYLYCEGRNAAGALGVWFFWSRLNGTQISTDSLLSISATTTGGAYGVALDIVADTNYGWDTVCRLTVTARLASLQGLTSLEIHYTDASGAPAVQALASLPYPGDETMDWSELDTTHFYALAQEGNTITVLISPEWAAELAHITLSVASTSLDDAGYLAQIESQHVQSIFAGFGAVANKRDQLTLVDENGAVAAAGAALNGMEFEVIATPGAIPGTDVITITDPLKKMADVVLTDAQKTTWAATGEAWLKVDVPAGACVKLAARMIDVTSIAAVQDAAALAQILGRVIS